MAFDEVSQCKKVKENTESTKTVKPFNPPVAIAKAQSSGIEPTFKKGPFIRGHTVSD